MARNKIIFNDSPGQPGDIAKQDRPYAKRDFDHPVHGFGSVELRENQKHIEVSLHDVKTEDENSLVIQPRGFDYVTHWGTGLSLRDTDIATAVVKRAILQAELEGLLPVDTDY